MRIVIAALILMAGLSFGGAFWMVFKGREADDRRPSAAEQQAASRDAAKAKPPPEKSPPSDPAPTPSAGRPVAASSAATPPAITPAPAQTAQLKPAPTPAAQSTPKPEPAAQPSPFPLALPIDCTPGESCWVINHVDLDPGPGRLDYRCGQMSYDGHKGTDIALRDLSRLNDNVAVLAAAPGKVVGVRDGMQDVSIAVAGRESVRDKECGNGVRVQHEGGWVTQYCHMKRGSMAVQTGQTIAAGQRLGAVGLSGMTEFPHVHITVEKDGKVIDPFRGTDGGPECGRGTAPLWNPDALSKLVDHAPILLDAGFGTGPVEKADAEAGTAGRDTAPSNADALVIWTRAAGLEPGDVLTTTITSPDGSKLFSERWRSDQTRIVQFRFVGKKRPPSGWQTGTYTGRVVLERDGRPPKEQTVFIRVGG
ncbi:Peptidase M23B [alpha proteobacterium BAL199]|nr:Peptidase M23B [alpha proteobacterium BAL199]